MNSISYHVRILVTVTLSILSFLIPAIFEPVSIKLIGVGCASLSSGFGEITFLAYSSYFNKNTVSFWSSGTGAAGIFGSASWLGKYVILIY